MSPPDDTTAASTPPPAGSAALGALAAFTLAGVVDGLATYARTPPRARSLALLGWCVVHGAGVLALLGLAAAAAQEIVLRAAGQRPTLRRLGAWVVAGPRAWWQHDPRAALVLASTLAGAVPALGALTWVVWTVTRSFHSRQLMVTPIAAAAPAAVLVWALSAVVAAWPVAALLRRAPRLASVGAVASVALVASALVAARVVALERDAIAALDPLAFVVAFVGLALDLALVARLALPSAPPARRARVPALAVAAALACAGLALVPALGLGRRQRVLIALSSRSLLARRVIGPLQRVVDRDRDGHGVLFGGGDCDDRDPRAFPGAIDTPGNGVDESCSGRDAVARTRPPRGARALAAGAATDRPPSVLFLSIDAVRPDRTTVYGYDRPTTPNLARFAQRAARFTRAYAVAPGSLRSFASTFTGRYPGDVVWGPGADPHYPAVADENLTLAESLRAVGYDTAAFTNTSYFSGTPGFYQGFDLVDHQPEFKDAAAPAARAAAAWIERPRERPFFAWVHLIDPHAPYAERPWPRDFGRTESDRYDAEVALADVYAAQVLAAVDRVEQRGEPVVVVVFSDHGEGFNEHGARYHYYDVHEEAIRVVLLVRGPGIAPGDRAALTALLDLHPTVLELARSPDPESASSRSLVPALLDARDPAPDEARDEVYADVAEHGGARPMSMALVVPPWKIAFDARRSVWELYDLGADPGEQRNLYDDEPARAAELRARLLDGAGRR